jgi:hypothetical protein
VATIIDTGSATAGIKGELLIDITAIEIDSTDEIYDIVLQGSPDAAFGTAANVQELAQLSVGVSNTKRTDSDKTNLVGRYTLPFTNEAAGVTYRYLRLYTVVAGTIVTGINYSAYAAVSKS